MTSLEAERRNRGQAAFEAFVTRMGHPRDRWHLLSEVEVEAWCAAGDAAMGYGFKPIGPFAGNTCCAGTVMTGAVTIATSGEWAGNGGGAGAAPGAAGFPFMAIGGVGGGGGAVPAVPQTTGSGTFPMGSGPR